MINIRYSKLDATLEAKSLVQSLRKRLDLTERQTIGALLLLAVEHETELKSIADLILDVESQGKAAKKAAKKDAKAPKAKKKAPKAKKKAPKAKKKAELAVAA